MTVLSNFAPQAVLPLSDRDPVALGRSARESGHTILACDCTGTRSREEVLQRIGTGFGLPDHYGCNLDALHDCLTDLPPHDPPASGVLVLLLGLPDEADWGRAEREALLAVFHDAAEYHGKRHFPFRVFHSVAAPAPAAA